MRTSVTGFLLFAALVASGALAGTYKWVDKDGNVHYSDQPVEGAEEVELPEPTTFDAPPAPRLAPSPSEADQEPQDEDFYQQFTFISPKEEQVFWATGGEIPVHLALSPALRSGDSVQLYLDGELVEPAPLAGLGTTLTGVYRGAHTVRAVVVTQDGRELAVAGPVTFHVKQRSIANPQRRRGN